MRSDLQTEGVARYLTTAYMYEKAMFEVVTG